MNLENMSFREYVEYAEVYRYSQDYFMMEKMFMELNLINLHLESYEYLQEHGNRLSTDQVDVLMVESVGGQDEVAEIMFLEKGGRITDAIGKMLKSVAKAVAAFFRKIGDAFKKKNDEVAVIEKEENSVAEMIQQVSQMGQLSSIMNEDNPDVAIIKENMMAIVSKVSNNIGGGGPTPDRIIPAGGGKVITPDAKIINDAMRQIEGLEIPDKVEEYIESMTKESQKDSMLAIIVDFDAIIEEVCKVIKFDTGNPENDNASEDDYDVYNTMYQSAKSIAKMGDKGTGNIQRLCHRIETACNVRKEAVISKEFLQKKLEAADKFYKMSEELARLTDIGYVDNQNLLTMIAPRVISDTGTQAHNKAIANNYMNQKVKTDKDMKGNLSYRAGEVFHKGAGNAIKKSQFRNTYTVKIQELHLLASKLRDASAIIIQSLNNYINNRNECINAKVKSHNAIKHLFSNALNSVKGGHKEGESETQPAA